jgi:hypothetical protein
MWVFTINRPDMDKPFAITTLLAGWQNCDLLSMWSAKYPDLNPIELFWAILKNMMAKLTPNTFDKLKQVLNDAWTSIPQATINKFWCRFALR